MTSLSYRWIQLDLQRQYETVDYICDFIRFAESCHYNGLLLSFGDRVTTPSYPYRKGYEDYTADDINTIVRCGQDHGVDIIPGIPTLGHAEDFLKHPEMEEMAELRHQTTGRWGDSSLIDFCPNSPQLQDFLNRYLTELAELFPSPWIHVGLDEAWNIGYCERCRPIAQQPGGEGKLCLQSLLQTHQILTKLGKRMMIWDDMFDYYPEILEQVPRDVVMVDWQYQSNANHYEAHFTDLRREERLATYNRLGFDFFLAPADYDIANIRSLCAYGMPYRPLGGLLTLWCKYVFLNEKSFPAAAYAGAMFDGQSPEQSWNFALKQTFQQDITTGSATEAALKFALESSWIHSDMLINPVMLTTQRSFGEETTHTAALQLALAALEPLTGIVAQDLKDALEGAILRLQIHQQFYEAAVGRAPLPDLNATLQAIDAHSKKRQALWDRLRPGITPCRTTIFYDQCKGFCTQMHQDIGKQSYLRIRFMLPVQYGAPITTLSLKINGAWQQVGRRGGKMFRHAEADWDQCRFECLFFCPPCQPDAIRITVSGYGGTGIEHVEYHSPDAVYLPVRITRQEGEIIHPDYLLTDDARFTWLGSGDIHGDFLNPPTVTPLVEIELNH